MRHIQAPTVFTVLIRLSIITSIINSFTSSPAICSHLSIWHQDFAISIRLSHICAVFMCWNSLCHLLFDSQWISILSSIVRSAFAIYRIWTCTATDAQSDWNMLTFVYTTFSWCYSIIAWHLCNYATIISRTWRRDGIAFIFIELEMGFGIYMPSPFLHCHSATWLSAAVYQCVHGSDSVTKMWMYCTASPCRLVLHQISQKKQMHNMKIKYSLHGKIQEAYRKTIFS